jgi:fructosamine-3-kinase
MNPLPPTVVAALRAADGHALRIEAAQRIGGGSIAAAYRLHSSDGPFFLKLGAADHPFDAEADALRAIAATGTLRVPRPLAHGTAADGHAFLLLEWIELRDHGDEAAAGAALAQLHAHVAPRHGWHRDNAIGASPQFNGWLADWSVFWRERRLRPQFELARRNGLHTLAALEQRACAASDALLARHAPAPSLLHGDLWRGNLGFDATGSPVVFDPACYHGDAEAELAMTRLFGGFGAGFQAAYQALRPSPPGWRERDRLYRLYHLLNHANLFGGGYVAQATALIESLAR